MRILLFLALITAPVTSIAHSGRTDASGCHTEKATGDYHCHNDQVSLKTPKLEARTEARTTARDYNCVDFSTHVEAQEVYARAGGPLIDPYDLDRDSDGVACEDLK